MSAEISCPNCGAELDAMTLFSCAADQQALARLAALSIPLGARVLQYVQLFKPERQNLTARKKVKLLLALLPDLERRAINYKGREWRAPLQAWAQAIDQMLAMRDAGRLKLPMTQHNYLYAILAGMAEKHEAAAEAEREANKRAARQAHVRGQAPDVSALLDSTMTVKAARPPRKPKTTSPTVRAMREEMARARAPSDTSDPNENTPPQGETHEQ